ncbi:protein Hook homolog 1-like [Xenia sp. Carnegie-2017]|uniref:protein Hook homolog 1-like n=1 Tax=Xenia sp. Carnegie-2017 TaxID=2897299 RepID=UPI001F034FA8|nr:protein Hook homolog 1-like [Xenia sp. Carnegie-2017]
MSQLTTKHFDDESLVESRGKHSFVDGIKNLDRIIRIVFAAKITNKNSARQVLKQLPPLVVDMCNSFKKSLNALEDENEKVSKNLEEIVAFIGRTRKNLTLKTTEMEQLKAKLSSLRDDLSRCRDELQVANQSLSEANEAQNNAEKKLEEKKREKAIATGVGVAAFAIPVVGLIVGSTAIALSLTVFQDAVNEAKRRVGSAEENINSCKERIKKKTNKLDELEKQQSKVQDELNSLQQQLEQLNIKKKELEQEQKKCADVSTKLKKIYSIVGVISGRSKVLELETKFGCHSLENLMNPLEEIARQLLTSEEDKREVAAFFSSDIDYKVFSQNLEAIREHDKDGMLKLIDVEMYS